MQDWPFPIEDDGLFKIHDALRMDMDDIKAIAERLSLASTVHSWENLAFTNVWTHFEKWVHEHHETEENIFFPWIATRIELPERLASDHVALMDMLLECARLVEGHKYKEFSSAFTTFKTEMELHFVEEEKVIMPQLRDNFTRAEQKLVDAEIAKNLKLLDIGHLLRPLDKKAQIKWMKSVAEIPAIIIYLVMIPAIWHFNRTVGKKIRALKSGEQQPGCAC